MRPDGDAQGVAPPEALAPAGGLFADIRPCLEPTHSHGACESLRRSREWPILRPEEVDWRLHRELEEDPRETERRSFFRQHREA